MKWHFNKTWAIVIAVLLAATLVVAQQVSTSPPQQSQSYMRMPMMSMMGGQHMGGMHAWAANLDEVVSKALQSNDAAQMKAALQQVHSRLTQWSQHMRGYGMGYGMGSSQGMHSGMMQGFMPQGADHSAHHNSPAQ